MIFRFAQISFADLGLSEAKALGGVAERKRSCLCARSLRSEKETASEASLHGLHVLHVKTMVFFITKFILSL